ncbi:MAG: hypothetical protein NTY46_15790 [Candidatus Sumerlaeota bacterium]|nr:hypothetical protein [Candidatus Sumerlaeota bacterium]
MAHPQYGRTYGEFRLFDHALTHSKLLAGIEPESRIWKITGRCKISNLENACDPFPEESCHGSGFDAK